MDDRENGPNVQLVQGVLIMLTFPDEDNYWRVNKDKDGQLWCPALSMARWSLQGSRANSATPETIE